jgi:cytidylate kinase
MAIITISRQYGSGGDEIATLVCERLGYRHFDKRLMAQVASEVKLSENEIAEFSEDNFRVRNFLDRLLGMPIPRAGAPMRAWRAAMAMARTPRLKLLDENEAIALVQGTIEASYQQGNMVIVGRGGQAILGDRPDVLHVRVEAPLKVRRQRIHEQGGLSLEVAHDVVIEHDQAVAEYLKRLYGIDWADSALYDLTINTGKLSLDAAAQLIVSAVRCLPPAQS